MTDNNFTKIYVVRHGEAEHNVIAKSLKPFDPKLEEHAKLTSDGIQQAKELAIKLHDIHFDAVFSSDMARAKQTAEILTLEKNLIVKTSQAIRERHFGRSTGKWHLLRREVAGGLLKLSEIEKMHYVYNDEETSEETASRLLTFIREIAIAYKGKTVLIVCHGAIMRMSLVKLGYAKFDEMQPHSITNTGYFILESDGIEMSIKETAGINKYNLTQ